LAPVTDGERGDLLEVIEDRSERTSTLIASQLPPPAWHAAIGEPSVADAICDRLIHRAHRLTLKGPTMLDPATRRGTKPPSSWSPCHGSIPGPIVAAGILADPRLAKRLWTVPPAWKSPRTRFP